MRIDEIKDKPVISIAEGEKLGEVQDLLLDASYLQLGALVIGGGGLFGGARKAVAYSTVRGIGPDAVMVTGQQAVQEVSDNGPLAAMHRVGDLTQQVLSESGVRLGRLNGVEFDPQTGAVTVMTVEPDRDAPMSATGAYAVPRDDVVSISDKLAVVRHDVVQRTAEGSAAQAPPASGL